MSGICGIVHGSPDMPVDEHLLAAMTARMAFRGPDARGIWHRGRVGLGHAMLRATFEAANERQPASLDGRTWIAADARIDARADLRAALAAQGRSCGPEVTDPELILHAYAAWGEDCVLHLLGDFAFAIWDEARQTLFCARDHFGVKPFFHACVDGSFVFSNTLDIVLAHPAVSPTLDDLAIADFLIFDTIQDSAGTAYAAVRRLPPAHCLNVREGVVRTRRYWALPRDHGVRYRDPRDYVARFTELLEIAVSDRLRTDRASISMSGGLDSPALAAAALRVARRAQQPLDLHAHTIVYDRIIADSERHFSQLAANALEIPIHHRAADDYPLYAGHDAHSRRFAEPSHEPEGAAAYDLMRDQAAHARVALMGWDGDALLNESPKPYFRTLLRERQWGRLAAGVARYAVSERRVLPRSLFAKPARASADDGYPVWLNPDLERGLRLRDRWRAAAEEPEVAHPLRPYAHRIFGWLDRWSNFFDRFDPGVSRLALEVRHPFLDLRLVDFCLSLPPLPWCVKKEILRASLTGVVPEAVRRRPKTALGNPGAALLARDDAAWVDEFVATPGLERYIERKRIPRAWRATDSQAAWTDLRPLTLNFWLQLQASKHPQETHA